MIARTPLYSLSVVLRETGLKPDVLRAWERRYQLPLPQRSAGGHRLYSEYDIETIKWLKAHQADGLSISLAVQLWREISLTSDPLENEPHEISLRVQPDLAEQNKIENYRDSWVLACLAYDSHKSEETLNLAFGIYPIEAVCTHVLQEGLSQIGNLWQTGKASPQQEHFASALAQNRMQALIAASPNPVIDKTILVGCPPGELHTFPLLLLNLFLRREGYSVINLGADIPLEQLSESISQIRPDLVILAAQRLATAATLENTAMYLSGQKVQLGFGGAIFCRIPTLKLVIAGHYLGDSIESSIFAIKQLLAIPNRVSQKGIFEPHNRGLALQYDEKRPFIDYKTGELLKEQAYAVQNLNEVNTFFGDGLSAALSLGDISYMESDLLWVNELMNKRNGSSALLVPYLKAYNSAIHHELGQLAAPITTWLDRMIAQLLM